MTDRSIAAVPGLASTSDAFRSGLWELAARHSWDVDAIAAVISSESGFEPRAKNPQPGQTATGLLQWIDSTARNTFGFGSSTIATMSREQQLRLVEQWYAKQLGDGMHRPVDYYLVGWGARPGLPHETVLARSGEKLYTLNSSLDVNHDGAITVSDLDDKVRSVLASAGGRRVPADPLGLPVSSASPSSSEPWGGGSTSLLAGSDAHRLTTLRTGDRGPDVAFLRALLGQSPGNEYDSTTTLAVKLWQTSEGLQNDGIVGPKTWGRLQLKVCGG